MSYFSYLLRHSVAVGGLARNRTGVQGFAGLLLLLFSNVFLPVYYTHVAFN